MRLGTSPYAPASNGVRSACTAHAAGIDPAVGQRNVDHGRDLGGDLVR
jgi:hypothetical protein